MQKSKKKKKEVRISLFYHANRLSKTPKKKFHVLNLRRWIEFVNTWLAIMNTIMKEHAFFQCSTQHTCLSFQVCLDTEISEKDHTKPTTVKKYTVNSTTPKNMPQQCWLPITTCHNRFEIYSTWLTPAIFNNIAQRVNKPVQSQRRFSQIFQQSCFVEKAAASEHWKKKKHTLPQEVTATLVNYRAFPKYVRLSWLCAYSKWNCFF